MFEWTWDERFKSRKSLLSKNNLEVNFHPGRSDGTAAVRGNKVLTKERHHYWEVKMVSGIYGTDVMIGVGTAKVNVDERDKFFSLLGQDRESWGLSYKGNIHHAGEIKEYSSPFERGSIVGAHLDTWKGTLQFFIDRKPLGIAFTGLRSVELYPMISSTAANSCMRITKSCSVPASLQMNCLGMLKPLHRSYLSAAFPSLRYLIDGVFAEILRLKQDTDNDNEDFEYEFPEEYMILDDFDFALVGFGRRKKRKIDDSSKFESTEFCRN
ncbi:SPRY domain-containing SOCS box protein 3 isoform X2 [Microplitis demolitor]|uniref:SPRY domain-containing SOCS box protein 3 isoform X2 n=1 Tax=Microplitis demolitor TaxID=69319 RepID=UPI00235B5E1F|nr:SPRY domain-containing SOCS box protein 3 isoform X2 [Microplitis demolitor]